MIFDELILVNRRIKAGKSQQIYNQNKKTYQILNQMKQFATIIAAFLASAAMAQRYEDGNGLPSLTISYAEADDYVLGLELLELGGNATTLKLPKSRAPRDENGERPVCSGWQLSVQNPSEFLDFSVEEVDGERGCTSW